MDKETRNKLRNTVTQCRSLLERAVADVLQGQFGIHQRGLIEDADSLAHLSAEDREYRAQVVVHLEHIIASGFKLKDAVQQLVREVAFTHLNRLCAFKMMEKRDLLEVGGKSRRAVSQGIKSQGFIFYLADHPDDEQLWRSGQQDIAYRHFIMWLGSTFTDEIRSLFSPNDPANRLFPPQRVLDQVLELINSDSLKDIWKEDETIGWIYQYFTPKELRDQARKESAAPRNSYELAFRNQFYTPSYVVQFLSDNTLGRIWYEMRQGETRLKGQCRYLVYRPKEKFLAEDAKEPASSDDGTIYIRYRAKKDPRDLKVLDPAGGSGHFLLYCFGLLQTIYEEAWDDPQLGAKLHRDYADLESFRKAVPGLILRHNLHCIDIDLRSTQIAALALWLRAQRAYQELSLTRAERPPITKSNIVCAEPMPGEAKLLEEFAASLRPKVLGDMVRFVFEKMKLAGEAGSLLKIEEEIRRIVAAKKRQYKDEVERATDKFGNVELLTRADVARAKGERQTALDLSDVTDEQFWENAEERILDELRRYSQETANGQRLLRHLFAEDTERGFAFVDICRKRFDVVMMNPPFGSSISSATGLMPMESAGNLYAAFVLRALDWLEKGGTIGCITDRTFLLLPTYQEYRDNLRSSGLLGLADLGWGVLDGAQVATCAYVVAESGPGVTRDIWFIDARDKPDKENTVLAASSSTSDLVSIANEAFETIPTHPIAHWSPPSIRSAFQLHTRFEPTFGIVRKGLSPGDSDRFVRLWWEVPQSELGFTRRWSPYANGGPFSPFYRSTKEVVDWRNDGEAIRAYRFPDGRPRFVIRSADLYGSAGLTYGKRGEILNVQILPEGQVFSNEGYLILPSNHEQTVWQLLAYLNSFPARYLVNMVCGLHKEVGALKVLPVPSRVFSDYGNALADHAQRAFSAARELRLEETNLDFCLRWDLEMLAQRAVRDFVSAVLARRHSLRNSILSEENSVNQLAASVFALTSDEIANLEADFRLPSPEEDQVTDSEEKLESAAPQEVIAELLSWIAGCVFGRWDVRLATGERSIPEPSDPFAPLPPYSPGMLTEGLGAYPLSIDSHGIAPDDVDHPNDIVRRVHEVFTLIWRERADAIEQEASVILGVKELRDYFRKPAAGGFWADHITRYSKSRRKAPIYWLLQSERKNYALWLYYQRLDRDMLSKALINYVEPKLRLEENRLKELRSSRTEVGATGSTARSIDRKLERQDELLSELRDFKEKLRRVVDLHLDPDLNDGVVLNIAPLWELVPWKEAKKCWDELQAGKYEWSSIAKQLRAQPPIAAGSS